MADRNGPSSGTHGGRNSIASTSRRNLLKAAGPTLAAGFAGCVGDGGGREGDGGAFEYWNTINAQSQSARQFSEDLVSQYEDERGSGIDVSWESLEGGVQGAKWLTSFDQGNYPVMYDSEIRFDGQFMEGGWPVPFEEYRDQFDQETLDAIEWILPTVEDQTSGLGGEVFEVPYGFILQQPFVGHMDHFEEAGLDPESDFPPEDYEHLIEVATTLQEDGPADYGYQVYGIDGDASDSQLPQWTVAAGGEEGLFLNDDWSDTYVDNDVWIEQTRNYVDVFREYELSHPKTPNAGDEDVPAWMASDSVSMAQVDFFMFPEFLDQAPGLVEDGTIRFAPSWSGQADQRAVILPYSLAITRPPEGADESEWESKQQEAIEFMKIWLQKENQRRLFENFGVFPVRQDVWEDVSSGPHNALEAGLTMAEQAEFAWSAHPQFLDIQYNTTAPYIQQALLGELTPEEACTQAANEIREIL